jgi:hypothetical protein
MNYFIDAWEFRYALLPCLFAYFVFELPLVYRRLTRKLYVPIYFAFFPFGHSDELYARYFDEDYYWMAGGPFKKEERPNARIKIIWVSMLSLGSGLIDHIQKMTMAAIAMADMKVWAQRS